MKKFLILNGPNLQRLGTREPDIYGYVTMETCLDTLRQEYADEVVFDYFQTNHEGEMLDRLYQADDAEDIDGIVLNPGAWCHTSLALADCLRAITLPVVEVHLSNIYAREELRHTSLTAPACQGVVAGFGIAVYHLGVEAPAGTVTPDEALEAYISAHTTAEPPLLHRLWRDTHLHRLYPRMCTDHVQGRLLAALSAMKRPQRVLEIGAFSGYSALCLAEGLAPGGEVHSIEIDDEAEWFIRRHLDQSPLGDRITLHIGDALELIPQLAAPWDMVYIDANKRTYTEYLELLLPRWHLKGVILADNTLWSGKVADPEAHDPQTLGLRRFNDYVAAHPALEAVMVPLRDGLTIIRKKNG